MSLRARHLTALLVAVGLERLAYFAARANIPLALRAPVSAGGLGFSAGDVAAGHERLADIGSFAPLLGGLLGLVLAPRSGLALSGVLLGAAYLALTGSASGSLGTGILLLAVGVGAFKGNRDAAAADLVLDAP